MKKWIAFVLAFVLAAAMAVPSLADGTVSMSPEEKGFAAVGGNEYRTACGPASTNMLVMYTEPAASSRVKARFYNGTVGILTHMKGEWGYVYMAGEKGYVQMSQLALPTTPVTPCAPDARVTNQNGARLELFVGSTVIATAPWNAKMTVLGLKDQQAIVTYGGMEWEVKLSDISIGASSVLVPTVTPMPSYPQATEKPFVFTGPVGYHDKAAWPLKLNEYTAAVNNPNPAHRLNLRVAPDKNSRSLGKYYNGVQVVINGAVEKNDKGEEWVKVSVCGLQGYMDNSFLNYEAEKNPASVMPVMKVHNTNPVGNLHLRSAQSTDSASLGLFENGTKVILMGFTGEWAHVIVNGQTGFMMAKYLK